MENRQINIGFSIEEKKQRIHEYLKQYPEVKQIVFFHPDKENPINIEGIDVEYRTWSDIIMYKYFYPLLEKIDHSTLLIFDELSRTKKRNDLTYNCAHHYGNQTDKIIVFQYLPVIDNPEDFMILMDYAFPNRYKGQKFSSEMLNSASIEIKPVSISLKSIDIDVTDDISEKYEQEKERLFETLGNKDPDTIPRQLHIWCGTAKKQSIKPDDLYIARNARFKKTNVCDYNTDKKSDQYTVIDFPVRRLQFIDFLRRTGVKNIQFLNSGLSVDRYYYGDYSNWLSQIREVFYG